ncbi:MAG: ribosome recycling factor [Planctomycetes bacterium]|nr:ribosome recycling factor [Planctomycetota bacterium]
MPYQVIMQQSEQRMQKTIQVMAEEIKGIRTGRASPALVDNIRVEYYGTQTPLKQLATISVPEPRLLVIKPFDMSCIGDIEKAILKSELGITPQSDGKLVRLAVPHLSEERRKQLSKMVKETAERNKVSVRNIRRDALKMAEDEEKAKTISEDEKFKVKDEMQKLTEKYEKEVDTLLEKKTKEIMEV